LLKHPRELVCPGSVRQRSRVSACVARMLRLSSVATLVILLARVPATEGGVTQHVSRPPAARPLGHAEAVRRVQELARRESGGRSGGGAGRSLAGADDPAEDPVQQVHLGLGGAGEAVVTFATWQRGLSSRVLFGRSEGPLDKAAEGQVSTYVTHICLTNADYLKRPPMSTNGGKPDVTSEALARLVNSSRLGLPSSSKAYKFIAEASEAWDALNEGCVTYENPLGYYQAPYIHTTVLTGLSPRTRYSYRPEAGNRTFSFTTPPAAGATEDGKPLKLGVWGDVGVTNVSFAVMQSVADSEPDVALLLGDYSYADGWSPKWETFGTLMEPLMSSVAGLGIPGNHDISVGNYQGVDWLQRYPQPYRQSGSESALFYSYETGPVHVLGLPGSYAPTDNATADRPSPQYLFAAEDLSKVDRARTPWVIVMFHTPWYNSNENHYGEGLKHQWDMEELLYRHGVDVVLSGHVHSYERSHPVYRYEADPCGATHLVVGDAGNYEGPAKSWMEPQPSWSAFREASFGSGLLTVYNATHAHWEWRRVACASLAANGGYYTWGGQLGSASGPACSTEGDNSEQSAEPVDSALLVRVAAACPNRAGAGRRLASAMVEEVVPPFLV